MQECETPILIPAANTEHEIHNEAPIEANTPADLTRTKPVPTNLMLRKSVTANPTTRKPVPANLMLGNPVPTPNFAVLISKTPEPLSPGTQEVPFLKIPRAISLTNIAQTVPESHNYTHAPSPAPRYTPTPIEIDQTPMLIGHNPTSIGHSPTLIGHSHTSTGHSPTSIAHSLTSIAHSHTAIGHSHTSIGHSHTSTGHTLTSTGHAPTSAPEFLREPAAPPSTSPAPSNLDQTVPQPGGSGESGLMESYIHIQNSLLADFNPYTESGVVGLDLDQTDDFLHGGSAGEELEERIKNTCTLIDIPMNPNAWSVEQVQKWAMFVLKAHGLSEPDVIMGLSVDGAMLTAMSKAELMANYPLIGETLSNELEVWWFGITPSPCGMSSALTHLSVDPTPEYCIPDTYDVTMASEITPSLLPPVLTPMTSYPYVSTESCLLPPLRSFISSGPYSIKQEIPDYIKTEIPEYIKQESPMFFSEQDVLTAHSENMMAAVTSSHDPAFSNYSNLSPHSLSSFGGDNSPCRASDDQEPQHHHAVVRPMTSRGHGGRHTIQLWMFLKELLLQPGNETSIRWLDRAKGVFKIEDSAHVAKLWGRRKNRPAMNYDKLSRSIRQYYKKGIIKKTGQSKRLVYQFCPNYNS